MKINGEAIKAEEFAYDGCHKIFLIEDEQDREKASSSGYNILPISQLGERFHSSCGSQFIMNWKLSRSYANHLRVEDVWFEATDLSN